MAKKITKYVAGDGTEFLLEKDADNYDRRVVAKKRLTEFLEGRIEKVLHSNDWKHIDLAVDAIVSAPEEVLDLLSGKVKRKPRQTKTTKTS